MPQVYRSQPQPTDADDSIYLSDLLRTGEASRLRRRGALRLDHARNADEEEPPTQRTWRYVRPQQPRDTDEDYNYTLYCGVEDTDEIHQETQPFQPSVIPWDSPPPRKRSLRPSNGCGALIHLHAAPHQKLGVWTAKTCATDAVVAMDPCYFDRAAVAKIVRSSCGCVREGVGCAVCGNPLGTRYRPCRTAADGLFSASRPKSSEPIWPEGPRYWRSHSQNQSKADPFIFTFFASAVTSSPFHTFTHCPPTHHHTASSSDEEDTNTPTVSNMMFDRFMTASPAPMSDPGEEDPESSFRPSGEPLYMQPQGNEQSRSSDLSLPFDPDGEMDIEEPGSPDKSNEMVILPDR